MKVFTYFAEKEIESTNIQYRWRTLLQFGNSWEIIGSVVMKNPGSSRYEAKTLEESRVTQHDILLKLEEIDRSHIWYEFKSDNTMLNIKKLFEQYYKTTKLNGVIQIFNLFNVREADLGKALIFYKKYGQELTFSDNPENLIKPIYLGWGDLKNDKNFRPLAEKYFEATIKQQHYLDKNFDNNPFYHPQYLMLQGANKESCFRLKQCFFQDSQTPIFLNKFTIKEEISTKLSYNKYETSAVTDRFDLTNELQLTITTDGEGYIAIRHKDFKEDYSKKEYENLKEIEKLLKDKNFPRPYEKYWLGQKNFNEYGKTEEEVIEKIILEINELQKKLQKLK